MSGDDIWIMREAKVDRASLGRSESLFALANGHIGLRGTLDEGEPRVISGTYLNGVYESYPLQYGERGYGFAEDGQTVVDVPDGKIVRLMVENEPVDIERGRVHAHERTLNLRTGLLERELDWSSAYGDRIRLRSKRLVSFVQRSVAAVVVEVEAVDRPLRVAVQSVLTASEADRGGGDADPRDGRDLGDVLDSRLATGRDLRAILGHQTKRSKIRLASGMDHVVSGPDDARVKAWVEADNARTSISVRLEPGEVLRVEKFIAYHWSSRQTVDWLRDQVDTSLENALAEGWDGLVAQQKRFLDDWWEKADIELDGDEQIQQALRFALFHLLQAGARVEGRAIAAKGLTGPGYDGHAFWDTEAFVLPVLTYLDSRSARDALCWRHDTLDLARDRARMLGMRGAMLPWRTIHGEECSGYWPAGLAAVHVNADVADAVRRYVQATGDEVFGATEGLDLLVETARLWADLGAYDREDRFRLAGVTGPDEYSALGDDNVFTNLMAQRNLRAAADAAQRHAKHAKRLDVDDEEIAAWRRAADAIHLHYDEARGMHPQHEGFLDYGLWDFEHTPADHYPLLLHTSYFELYRTQVVKQADLVLALWFRGDAFSDEEKARDFAYYEGITVRDSSLSAAAQSVVAAEVGHLGLAWRYLREAALADIHDLHGNTVSGLHMASLAGAVLSVTAGLGGMRDHGPHLAFRPRLPEAVERLRFRMLWRGTRLRVTVEAAEARYATEHGEPITIEHWGEQLEVGEEEVVREIPPAPELEEPTQPKHREPQG
ncbi:MAG: alpha,alpha-trehalose phosphorylase [Solirubrobacteraceae bacterium]|jgi:alpha,alpha-trehalose phosphorylase|nr:alpha,alpha-trehalose phosphorylase [Solirubrobacteraceae bacterium]